jgi:hypothetical protein
MAEQLAILQLGEELGTAEPGAPPGGGDESVDSQRDLPSGDAMQRVVLVVVTLPNPEDGVKARGRNDVARRLANAPREAFLSE